MAPVSAGKEKPYQSSEVCGPTTGCSRPMSREWPDSREFWSKRRACVTGGAGFPAPFLWMGCAKSSLISFRSIRSVLADES